VGKRRSKKSKPLQVLEYLGVSFLLAFARLAPLRVGKLLSEHLGRLLYALLHRRRSIALENLRHAFPEEKGLEHRSIACRSFSSFVLTCFEALKLQQILGEQDAGAEPVAVSEELRKLLHKARGIHNESGGCIFVTPHIGNWEVLPYAGSIVGIPLVAVMRPLDNVYLERLLYRKRAESKQIIIPKRNALLVLQMTLKQGKSIGMLPDQGTGRGIPVPFFGREAFTTPVPAMLAVRYHRPIVVVACCRSHASRTFEGVVADPIWPGEYSSEKEEIYRLTGRMNLEMEAIIRRYPEQYLWMHDRWKRYKRRRKFLA
jgi:Kdo2-lipid IVA lauroyltransferase/acyltransferase